MSRGHLGAALFALCFTYSLAACDPDAGEGEGSGQGGDSGEVSTSEGADSGDNSEEAETGDKDDSGEESQSDGSTPEGAGVEAMAKFLADKLYLGPKFKAETQTPRERSSTVSPHGRVRVFLNERLIDSQSQGLGTLDGDPHLQGSVAIKLFYDDEDSLVGEAMMYKHEEGKASASWAYYCTGPDGRCMTGEGAFDTDDPAFGHGHDVACAACHAGMVFTTIEAAPLRPYFP